MSNANLCQVKVAKFAQDLRLQLFKEHLGLLNVTNIGEKDTQQNVDSILADPLSMAFDDLWSTTARINTEVFRELFHCVPDDTVGDYATYKSFYPFHTTRGHLFRKDIPNEQVEEKLSNIRGHLGNFFSNVFSNVESSIPIVIFDP